MPGLQDQTTALRPGEEFDLSTETGWCLCESFLDHLAFPHGLNYNVVGVAELRKPQGYLERQFRGWIERYHGSKTPDTPEVETISPWVQQHMPSASAAAL